MLYHLDFRVEYPADMSQQDLLKIWAEEAEAALGAKKVDVSGRSLEMCRDATGDRHSRCHIT